MTDYIDWEYNISTNKLNIKRSIIISYLKVKRAF